ISSEANSSYRARNAFSENLYLDSEPQAVWRSMSQACDQPPARRLAHRHIVAQPPTMVVARASGQDARSHCLTKRCDGFLAAPLGWGGMLSDRPAVLTGRSDSNPSRNAPAPATAPPGAKPDRHPPHRFIGSSPANGQRPSQDPQESTQPGDD